MRLITLSVPRREVEVASDRLWMAGASAVEERSIGRHRVELRSVLADDDEVSRKRVGPVPDEWDIRFVDVDDSPPLAWRDHAAAIEVSDQVTITPAWIDPPDDAALVIEIEPGAAFGLGDHPTTRLTAGFVDELVEPGASVLDIGCGTGVQAILAKCRGSGETLAIDVSDAAVAATLDNASRNDVTVEASTTPLADVTGTFDVVIANILAPTLISMAEELRRVVGRDLVISGVLDGAHQHVIDALSPLDVAETRTREGWAAIRLRRRV